jgi:hypothetical protein
LGCCSGGESRVETVEVATGVGQREGNGGWIVDAGGDGVVGESADCSVEKTQRLYWSRKKTKMGSK